MERKTFEEITSETASDTNVQPLALGSSSATGAQTSREENQPGEQAVVLAKKVESLERRLAVQEDINNIQQLKALYVSLADEKYINGRPNTPEMIIRSARQFSELFTEDATWGGGMAGPLLKGRKAIYERISRIHSPFMIHYMVSPEMKVEGNKAYARWHVLNFVQDEKGNPDLLSGFEDDTYVKIEDKWYFQHALWTDIFLAPYSKGWAYPDAFVRNYEVSPRPRVEGENPWKCMPFRSLR